MKILLFCHLGQIPEFSEYIKALKKIRPVQSLLLTMGREEHKLALDVGVFDVVKDILPEQSELDIADSDLSLAPESLRKLEERIGYNFINRDILGDRFFWGPARMDIDESKLPLIWSGSRAKQFMWITSKRFADELASFSPDFIFVETHIAPNRMLWRLAREKGIPAGRFWPVRFWPERLYLETEIGYDWCEVRAAYSEMKDKPMTGVELAEVEQRLKQVVGEKRKPAYMQSEHAKGAPNFIKRLFATRTFSGPGSWLGARAKTYMRNPQILPSKVFSPIAKYTRYRNGQRAKRYLLEHQTKFEEIRTRRYAVYFLHVQPELTVEGMAFDYRDQLNTLSNILASLPADMELLVKEHSPMLGYRPLDVYRKLLRMPGLIVADTQEDSHDLITHAAVVVTLTGTVALEALLYGVPAIVLGSIYFDCFKGIYKPESLNDLKRLLMNPDDLSGATEEDALRALGSMLRASKPGRPPRTDPTKLEEIDINSAKVMMSELERLGGGNRCG